MTISAVEASFGQNHVGNLKSQETWAMLKQVLAGGVNSPVRSFRSIGITPLIAAKGVEDRIIDVDGREYLDFCCSWGALLWGHAHPPIIEAIQKAAMRGTSYGLSTTQEGELAERICAYYPSIERVRFVSTGTEATMSAVRLARAATKRKKILAFHGHYHGHADQFLLSAGSGIAEGVDNRDDCGVPYEFSCLTDRIDWNDMTALESYFKEQGNECAGVILEPVAINMGCVPPVPGYLERIRGLCRQYGALLIFDEVVTGFRLCRGGAQEYYNIQPDLTALGKIVGGGLPMAAFGGRRELMELLAPLGPVYQAGTLSGNPLAVAAGVTVMRLIEDGQVYKVLEQKADRFFAPIERHLQKSSIMSVQRVASMGTIFFASSPLKNFRQVKQSSIERYREFVIELLSKGIFIPPLQFETLFLSAVHQDEHLEYASKAIINALS